MLNLANALTQFSTVVLATPTRSCGAYYGMARYQTLAVEPAQDNAHVFKVTINRPEKSNAMNKTFWRCVIHRNLGK